jgi:hypothetical protein
MSGSGPAASRGLISRSVGPRQPQATCQIELFEAERHPYLFSDQGGSNAPQVIKAFAGWTALNCYRGGNSWVHPSFDAWFWRGGLGAVEISGIATMVALRAAASLCLRDCPPSASRRRQALALVPTGRLAQYRLGPYCTTNTGTLPSARTSDVWLPNNSFLMPRRP